ncbi:TRAP transporter large permease [Pusillimonas sp. CC-YST705]|uniref:TRAP transporter large permease protein n=1 Tax=Mesopusillimonas faecipullorum TaxID=2755040 RepID=A0ABS8CBF1_9BURK|nr:TRAP transporter large permease [Mesopusillimonas faecipullorum]MCB5363313.1 TRAP transporter large permease [Mesopusillimonas faecipullorum]
MNANLIIGVWCSLGLLALIALRIPVAISMIAAAVAGIYLVQGPFAAWFQLAGASLNATTYGLSVIPLFILMGNLAAQAGLSRDLFLMASRWMARLPGGLAVAAIFASAGFSTLSGSSLATAAAVGRISMGEMLQRGYSPALASGTIAAGGAIGILIPPSVMLVVYGLMTEQSIGRLFAAGVLPGILLTLVFMATVMIWAMLRPRSAGKAEQAVQYEKVPMGGIASLAVLVVIVLGGLYGGLFTATESAAVGAIGTLLIAWSRGGLSWQVLSKALIETASTTAMIFLIIIGSALYATFLSVTGISGSLKSFVHSMGVAPIVVLLLILLIYVVLGCFMDSMGMMLLTIPVFYPVTVQLGIDPILFGVLVVMVVEVGLITPPLGMNIFVVRSVAPQVPLQTIFAGALPFVLSFAVAIGIVIAWPALALWLPSLMKGG